MQPRRNGICVNNCSENGDEVFPAGGNSTIRQRGWYVHTCVRVPACIRVMCSTGVRLSLFRSPGNRPCIVCDFQLHRADKKQNERNNRGARILLRGMRPVSELVNILKGGEACGAGVFIAV